MTLPRLHTAVLALLAVALMAAGVAPWLNDHAAMTGSVETVMLEMDGGDHPCCEDAGTAVPSDCGVCLVGLAFLAAPAPAGIPSGERLAPFLVTRGETLAGIDPDSVRPPPRESAFS